MHFLTNLSIARPPSRTSAFRSQSAGLSPGNRPLSTEPEADFLLDRPQWVKEHPQADKALAETCMEICRDFQMDNAKVACEKLRGITDDQKVSVIRLVLYECNVELKCLPSKSRSVFQAVLNSAGKRILMCGAEKFERFVERCPDWAWPELAALCLQIPGAASDPIVRRIQNRVGRSEWEISQGVERRESGSNPAIECNPAGVQAPWSEAISEESSGVPDERMHMTVRGGKPVNLNNMTKERRLLGCYQLSAQVIKDGLAGCLDMRNFASLTAIEAHVQFGRSSKHREIVDFAKRARENSIESDGSFGTFLARQARLLAAERAPTCALMVRSSTHAMAVLLRHREDLASACTVTFFDPFRTNCLVELSADAAELETTSLRTYLAGFKTDVGHTFDALLEAGNCFLVHVFRPEDLAGTPTAAPQPLSGIPAGPVSPSLLTHLLENDYAEALEALRPRLLEMDGDDLTAQLCSQVGDLASPLDAAMQCDSVDAFRTLASVILEKLTPAQLHSVLLSNAGGLGSAYMNGRLAVIDCFLDMAGVLPESQRHEIHKKCQRLYSANYFEPRGIRAYRDRFGVGHFEPFRGLYPELEYKHAQVLSMWGH